MKKYGDVRTTTGVPVVADFNNPSGTPIVINLATGQGYYLNAAGVVTALAGGGTGSGYPEELGYSRY